MSKEAARLFLLKLAPPDFKVSLPFADPLHLVFAKILRIEILKPLFDVFG